MNSIDRPLVFLIIMVVAIASMLVGMTLGERSADRIWCDKVLTAQTSAPDTVAVLLSNPVCQLQKE